LLFLAEGYQAAGDHARALEVLDSAVDIEPALERDKYFRKMRGRALKNQFVHKPFKSKTIELARAIGKARTESDWLGKVAKLAAPVLIAIAVGAYLFFSVRAAKSPDVFIVNGLSTPYTVLVNGTEYKLPPLKAGRIKVPEGLIRVESSSVNIQPFEVTVKRPVLTRLFDDRTFVINPDGVAVIVREKTFYAAKVSDAPKGDSSIHTGRVLHVFNDLDFKFSEFPDEISLPSEHSVVPRSRICLFTDLGIPAVEAPYLLIELLGKETVIELLGKQLSYEPENEFCALALYNIGGPRPFIETVRPLLDRKPCLINCHRLYQEAMKKTDSRYDLVSEYKKRLTDDPDNSSLMYLLGRVEPEPEQANEMFHKSIEGDSPCPYGYVALGYNCLSEAEFDPALKYFRQAYLLPVLYACRRYDEAIDLCRKLQSDSVFDISALKTEVGLWTIKDSPETAKTRVNEWLGKKEAQLGPQMKQYYEKMLLAEIAYVQGDIDEYCSLLPETTNPEILFTRAISANEPVDANLFEQLDCNDIRFPALRYIHELRNSRRQEAQKYFVMIIDKLKDRGPEEDLMAKHLSDPNTVKVDKILSLPFEIRDKAILLTVLGLRYEKNRRAYFELARKLNYDLAFPHWFLDAVLTDAKTKRL
jgi:tetratricopeptide (TPR) repeat protein